MYISMTIVGSHCVVIIAIWTGIHPCMNINFSEITVPKFNVSKANTFNAMIIIPINMMVHIFINFTVVRRWVFIIRDPT